MNKSGSDKHNKGKEPAKKTSQNQTQNMEREVPEERRFCSRCKTRMPEPQTDSPTSSTREQNLLQEEGCREQGRERKEQGKEDNIRLTGYYCETCNRRYLLRGWEVKTNGDTKRHHKRACTLTGTSSSEENLKVFELMGYYCSMCKQEWSLEGDTPPSEKVVDGICLQSHSKCEQEIKREGPVEAVGYFCLDCGSIRPLEEWHVDTESDFENTIRDYHANTGCLSTLQKYEERAQVIPYSCTGCNKELLIKEWYGNPIPKTENAIRDHHHRTGCRGKICPYGDNDIIIGYFCSYCKKEFLLNRWNRNPAPDINYKPVDHHIIPMFCCLQISDTGNYVKWKNITRIDGLSEGDHVAWQRCLGYWHHAIVERVNDDGSLNVIEWNINCCGTGIYQNRQKKLNPCNFCSCMYQATYPEEVLQQNPPNLVLSRARARLNETEYSFFSDNCEHFATYCKTGCHQSAQLFHLNVSLHGWCRRFVGSLIHIVLIALISESTESAVSNVKEFIGIILLVATEIIYLMIVMLVIYIVDTTRASFTVNQPPKPSSACRCSSIKAVIQSAFLLGFAIFFSFYVKKFVVQKDWTEFHDFLVETALVIFGGGIGNIVGFWLLCCLCTCCRRNEAEQQTCCCTNTSCRSCREENESEPDTNTQTREADASTRGNTDRSALI